MATSKSSTKAKPKAKKVSTARAKTTRAATKAPAKATTKATPQVAAAKVATATSQTYPATIRKLLALSVVVYAALAIAAVTYMTTATYQLTVGYLTNDALASKTQTVFAPATRVLFDIELRWLVVTFLLLSAVMPLLYLTRWRRKYAERLQGRVQGWRWIDMAVTGALMVEITALLSGMQDIGALKLSAGLIAVSAVLCWVAERQNENVSRPVWSAFLASTLSLALVGAVIATYAAGTFVYGAVRSPWYVYAVYGVLVATFVLCTFNQINQHRRFRNWKNYVVAERNHLIISLFSKAAFALVLIVGLLQT